jgi:ABC-2 type transport system permease protein
VTTVAPMGRILRSELRWVFRRPRTIVALTLLAAVPVAIGIGVAMDDPGGPGASLVDVAVGNGLVLPVGALSVALFLLLPLVVSMSAADALAGESAHGTLRGLLLAPVSRERLVVVKSVGVLGVATAAVAVVAGVAAVMGTLVVGGPGGGALTLSGTTLSTWATIGRVLLAAAWTVGQLCAIGAIALAVSSLTEHPLVVLAVSMGALVITTVLMTIPALDWLQPVLLPTGWPAIGDVLRDPVVWDELGSSTFRAGCYVLIGGSLALARTLTRDS